MLFLFVVAISVAVYFFTSKFKPFQTSNNKQMRCYYYGKDYISGQNFKSIDGCNTCSCDRGQISCTEMACQ